MESVPKFFLFFIEICSLPLDFSLLRIIIKEAIDFRETIHNPW